MNSVNNNEIGMKTMEERRWRKEGRNDVGSSERMERGKEGWRADDGRDGEVGSRMGGADNMG